MAYEIPDGYGLARCTFRHSAVPKTASVSWGYQNAGSISASAVASLIEQQVDDSLLAVMDDSVTFVNAAVLQRQGIDLFAGVAVSGDTGGGGSFAMPPPQVTAVVTKRTALAGVANRGRMYLPYVIPDVNVDDAGVISTIILAGIQTRCDELLAGLDLNGIPMYLLRDEESPPRVPREVTSLQAQGIVATQRRRLR